MASNVGILLIWIGASVLLQVDRVHGDGKCVFPFIYGGMKYFDCTSKGAVHKWCSLDEEYVGRWIYCTKDDYAQCSFPFIYDGKAYDGCTNDGSIIKMSWCSLSANYDKDRAWRKCF